jgi:hypothetical protein
MCSCRPRYEATSPVKKLLTLKGKAVRKKSVFRHIRKLRERGSSEETRLKINENERKISTWADCWHNASEAGVEKIGDDYIMKPALCFFCVLFCFPRFFECSVFALTRCRADRTNKASQLHFQARRKKAK